MITVKKKLIASSLASFVPRKALVFGSFCRQNQIIATTQACITPLAQLDQAKKDKAGGQHDF